MAYSIEFYNIWKYFNQTGNSKDFIKKLVEIHGQVSKEKLLRTQPYVKTSSVNEKQLTQIIKNNYGQEFEMVVHNGLKNYMADEKLNPEKDENFILHCLKAINEVKYKPDALLSVKSLLQGSIQIGKNISSVSPQGEVLIEESFKEIMNETQRSNESKQIQTAEVKEKLLLTPEHMKLTMKSFTVFPILEKIILKSSMLSKLIELLIMYQNYSQLLKLLEWHRNRIPAKSLLEITISLANVSDEAVWLKAWRCILLPVETTSTNKRPIASDVNTTQSSTLMPNQKQPPISYYSSEEKNWLQMRALLSYTPEDVAQLKETFLSQFNDSNSISSGDLPPIARCQLVLITLIELMNKRKGHVCQKCLQLCTVMGLNEFVKEIHQQMRKAKIEQFAMKGKWMIAAQMVKSIHDQLALFQSLRKKNLFAEAQSVYHNSLYPLHELAQPITEAELLQQKVYNQNCYLPFPSEKVSIHMINSFESLQVVIKSLGLNIQMNEVRLGNVTEIRTNEELKSEAKAKPSVTKTIKKFRTLQLEDILQSLVGLDGKNGPSLESVGSLHGQIGQHPSRFKKVIGLDAEWKMSLYQNNHNTGASILQMSTRDQAFLFDFQSLSSNKTANVDVKEGNLIRKVKIPLHLWSAVVLSNIFSDESILKIGFDFQYQDTTMIQAVGNGSFTNVFRDVKSFIDLSNIAKKLNSHPKTKSSAGVKEIEEEILTLDEVEIEGMDELQSETIQLNGKMSVESSYVEGNKVKTGATVLPRTSVSLSSLCQRFLGKPLHKAEQLSNWNTRPLTKTQQQYAALDAYCLLSILDAVVTDSIETSRNDKVRNTSSEIRTVEDSSQITTSSSSSSFTHTMGK